ncbi:MAG: restriction endonuclease, partial [Sphaerospermopsis kisseleviana]
RQAHQQYQEISEIRRERPPARIIGLARDQGWFGQADLTLQLKGLNHADLHEFLQKLGVAPDGQRLEFDLLEGSPLLAQMIAEYSKRSTVSPRQILERLAAFRYSGLIGLDGRPLVRGTDEEKQIIVDIRSVSDGLLAKAYSDPSLLYEITPRRFEEFVAELLDRLGYDITLTPASNDGGKDIYAAKRDDLGTFLYVVECKKYSPDHKVGVGLIRELNGVVQAERATAGILATTSFFTKGAKEFQERLSNQISLKDYLGLQEWMSKALKQ